MALFDGDILIETVKMSALLRMFVSSIELVPADKIILL